MTKTLKLVLKVLNIIFISVMAIILLSNLYVLIARKATGNPNPTVFGYTSAVVLTGSMETAISPNDMVIVHKQSDYAVKDIVMFKGNSSTVTHRIIEVKENGYITQGDANNTDDGEIPKSQVIGKVILIIPRIGAIISFFQSPLGMLILILILFFIIELPNFTKRKAEDSDKKTVDSEQ